MTYHGHIKNGVAVLDTPADLPDGTPVQIHVADPEMSFWQNKSVEELSREQGTIPIQNLEELSGDWPEDDSIEEFMSLVRKVRH